MPPWPAELRRQHGQFFAMASGTAPCLSIRKLTFAELGVVSLPSTIARDY